MGRQSRRCWAARGMWICSAGGAREAKQGRFKKGGLYEISTAHLGGCADGRIGNAELFEVGFVLRRVEVELFEFGDELLHFFPVEFDGGLVGGREERFVVDVFRLDIAKMVPSLRDELRF